jgi:hypothetical protein
MTIDERITRIRDELITCDRDFDLVDEVRGLLDIFDDAIYRQKIRDAISWAEVYTDPQQTSAWDTEVQSGCEAITRYLFGDLDDAAERARELQPKR